MTLSVLLLMAALQWPCPLAAAPVPVRFAEGLTHGFVVLRTLNGVLIASGDLLQFGRGREVESRMVFRFKDGSLFDETVVFTQQRVFTMKSFHLVQRGPAFSDDTEISLERATGKYHVKTKAHKDGKEEVLDGTLRCQRDCSHSGLHPPTPRLIELELVPVGEHRVLSMRSSQSSEFG